MRMTRAIYDSSVVVVVLSAIPIRWSRVRACMQVWLSRSFFFFFFMYVSRDDRMSVTKEGNGENENENWTVLIFWNGQGKKR
jgi:hypothetical protein